MTQFTTIFHNKQFQNIAVCQILTIFSAQFLLPVMPLYLKIQGFSDSQIGLIMGISAVGAVIIRPWAGLNVDTRGSRTVILWGQSLLALCTLAYLGAIYFLPLLIVRFFHGVAMAFYGTGAVTFAASVETPRNTSVAISLFTMFTMMGLGIATGSAPVIFQRQEFSVLVLISVIALLLAGSIMLFRTQSILPNGGMERVPFRAVLHTKEVLAPTICLFASNFAFSTSFTFIPLVALADRIENYSSFYISFTVAVVIARFAVQEISRIWSAKKTAVVASMLNAFSVLLIAIHPSVLTFIISGISVGIGFGVIFPSLAVYVVANTNPANKGTALGILSAAGDVGTALGASVLGVIAQMYGYRIIFLAATLVVLVCVYYFNKALAHSTGRAL